MSLSFFRKREGKSGERAGRGSAWLDAAQQRPTEPSGVKSYRRGGQEVGVRALLGSVG